MLKHRKHLKYNFNINRDKINNSERIRDVCMFQNIFNHFFKNELINHIAIFSRQEFYYDTIGQ